MGRIRPMSPIRPIERRSAEVFLAAEFQASFARAVQLTQICGLPQLVKVLIVRHVLMLAVLPSLPEFRVSRDGLVAWRPAIAPLAAIR